MSAHVITRMGDARYEAPYERLVQAADRARELHDMEDDEVIHALAHASREHDPLLANVLAVEATNRMHRSRVTARAIGEGIIGFDDAARVNYVNPACEQALGRSAAQLRGNEWDPANVASHQDARLAIVRVLETGQASPLVEDTWCPPHLPIFDVEWQVYPIRRDQDTVGAVLVFRNITERVQQRTALVREREKLHAILENVTEGIMLLDADGSYSFANSAALQILGIDRDSLFRSSPEERPWRVLQPDGTPMPPADYPGNRSLREERRIAAEFAIRRPDGARTTVLLDAQPIFDERDRLAGSVINFAKVRGPGHDLDARTFLHEDDKASSMMRERARDEVVRDSEAYLSDVLEATGVPLGPKVERVTEDYAEERIKEKIAHFEPGRPQAGLWSTNEVLKEHGVPPAFRLHLITAVAHLGRIGKDSLEARRARSGAEDRKW